MPDSAYSEQDLRYAAELREGIHKEALAILQKQNPTVQTVVDRYPVEAYFQQHWDYPGKWYTVVAVPPDCGGRKKLISQIVRDTLDSQVQNAVTAYRDERYCLYRVQDGFFLLAGDKKLVLTSSPYEPCLYITDKDGNQTTVRNAFDVPDVFAVFQAEKTVTSITGREYTARDFCELVEYAEGRGKVSISVAEQVFDDKPKTPRKPQPAADENRCPDDAFYALYEKYANSVIDFCIVKIKGAAGENAHREALFWAAKKILQPDGRKYEIAKAKGHQSSADELFALTAKDGVLTYRKAFLQPPHQNSYTYRDFELLNKALFPNGKKELEVYGWTTDWSDYFDDGHEWWGTLCYTVYDKTLDRFVVILASATD